MKIPTTPLIIIFSLIFSLFLTFFFFPNLREKIVNWQEVEIFQARIFSIEEIGNSPFWDRFRTKDYTPRFFR